MSTETKLPNPTPKPGLRAAINSKCRECIYDPHQPGAGAWRQQVAACTSRGCPLFPVRPTSKAPKASPEEVDSGAI